MYENWTDRARKVMQLAKQESRCWNHKYLGTEAILVGLMKEGSGVACNVLKNLGLDLKKIRLEVEKEIQISDAQVYDLSIIKLTSSAERVVKGARRAAEALKHNYVGTEHILIALMAEEDGAEVNILRRLGLTACQIETEVLNLLGHQTEEQKKHESPIDEFRKVIDAYEVKVEPVPTFAAVYGNAVKQYTWSDPSAPAACAVNPVPMKVDPEIKKAIEEEIRRVNDQLQAQSQIQAQSLKEPADAHKHRLCPAMLLSEPRFRRDSLVQSCLLEWKLGGITWEQVLLLIISEQAKALDEMGEALAKAKK